MTVIAAAVGAESDDFSYLCDPDDGISLVTATDTTIGFGMFTGDFGWISVLRFEGVNIPARSIVTSATLTGDGNGGSGDGDLTVVVKGAPGGDGELIGDDSGAFNAWFASLFTGSAEVEWNITGTAASFAGDQSPPDLSSLVQEHVDTNGAITYMTLLISAKVGEENRERRIDNYGTDPATLDIEYTPPIYPAPTSRQKLHTSLSIGI